MSAFTLDFNTILTSEVVLEEGLANVRKKYLTTGLMDEQIFHELLQADPTQQKKYSDWTFKQIFNDFKNHTGRVDSSDEGIFDTIGEINQALLAFEHGLSKGFVTKKDINQYKTLRELFIMIGEIRGKESKTQQKKDERYDETEKVFENDKYLIVNPRSWNACKIWGKGAQWCIGYESSSQYWSDYTFNKELKFYFVLNKSEDSLHDPMAKVALGVDPMDEIREAFDARDESIDPEPFLDTLKNEGVPVNEIFIHEGWDDIRNEDADRELEKLQIEYDADIENAEFKYCYVDAYSDYYDEGMTPEDSFMFSAGMEIKIPKDMPLLKPLDKISQESLDAIKELVDDYYASEIDEVNTSDDGIRIHLDTDTSNGYGTDRLADIISNVQDLEGNYNKIFTAVIGYLNKDGIIKTEKFQKYLDSVSEIDKAYDSDDKFRDFDNIAFSPYDDEVQIDITFNNIRIYGEREVLNNKLNLGYRTTIEAMESKTNYMLRKTIQAIVLVGKNAHKEYYDPKQTLFKDILPDQQESLSNKEIDEIATILETAEGTMSFVLNENKTEYRIYRVVFIPEIGSNINLLINFLERVDNSYSDFNVTLAEKLNDGLKTPLFEYKPNPIRENFNGLLERLMKRRV